MPVPDRGLLIMETVRQKRQREASAKKAASGKPFRKKIMPGNPAGRRKSGRQAGRAERCGKRLRAASCPPPAPQVSGTEEGSAGSLRRDRRRVMRFDPNPRATCERGRRNGRQCRHCHLGHLPISLFTTTLSISLVLPQYAAARTQQPLAMRWRGSSVSASTHSM